jgi:hypothetical protein
MARDHQLAQPNTWKVELGLLMACPRNPWERVSLFVPANGRDKAVCFATGRSARGGAARGSPKMIAAITPERPISNGIRGWASVKLARAQSRMTPVTTFARQVNAAGVGLLEGNACPQAAMARVTTRSRATRK